MNSIIGIIFSLLGKNNTKIYIINDEFINDDL